MFSFGGDLWRRRMSFLDCLEAVASLGPDQGVELIGAQAFRSYPEVSGQDASEFRDWVERTGLVLVDYCTYLDRARSAARTQSPLESLGIVEAEIGVAKRLGFPKVRINTATPDLLEPLARLAERHRTPLLVELAGEPRTDPETAVLVDAMVDLGSPLLGVIIDGSAFVRRVPEPWVAATLAGGVPAIALDTILESWLQQQPVPETAQRLSALSMTPLERELATYALFTSRALFRRGDVAGLYDLLPLLHHMQTKFFAADPGGADPCVPYDEIIPLLRGAGFGGRLHAEFEGGLWDPSLDTVAELRRHQGYLTRLWDSQD